MPFEDVVPLLTVSTVGQAGPGLVNLQRCPAFASIPLLFRPVRAEGTALNQPGVERRESRNPGFQSRFRSSSPNGAALATGTETDHRTSPLTVAD